MPTAAIAPRGEIISPYRSRGTCMATIKGGLNDQIRDFLSKAAEIAETNEPGFHVVGGARCINSDAVNNNRERLISAMKMLEGKVLPSTTDDCEGLISVMKIMEKKLPSIDKECRKELIWAMKILQGKTLAGNMNDRERLISVIKMVGGLSHEVTIIYNE